MGETAPERTLAADLAIAAVAVIPPKMARQYYLSLGLIVRC